MILLRKALLLAAGLGIGFATGQIAERGKLAECRAQTHAVIENFQSLCESFNRVTDLAYGLMPNQVRPARLACEDAVAK